MNDLKKVLLCLLVFSSVLALGGCGKKADESKPISEVKVEADKMNVGQLKSMAVTYKNAIVAKQGEVTKVAEQLKDLGVAKALSEKAKGLKADIDSLNKSVSALNERFKIYVDKLKEKGGDLSGLEI